MEKENNYLGPTGGTGASAEPKPQVSNLFLYRKADEFSEQIIKKQQLYFSSPLNFNDPFECPKNDNNRFKGILCLSKSEPEKNTLMWSHYTDKHKGLCFEFAKIELFYDNNREEKIECEPQKVEYDKARPIPLLTKDLPWFYENEYRIILNYEIIKKNKHLRTFVFNEKYLEKIYFGVNALPDTIEKYKQLCANIETHKVKLYEMKNAGQYLLKKEEIDY